MGAQSQKFFVMVAAAASVSGAAYAGDYYSDIAAWPVTSESGFSIASPIDFDIALSPQSPTGWRWNSPDPGTVVFELTIPRAVEPQTNFDSAYLTIGTSSDPKSVADCAAASEGADKTWKMKINGVEFAAFSASDNGMGHFHDITSFRAVHGGKCYAIETTIQSTNIGAYPSNLGLKPFNETRIKMILDRIVKTFKFAA